MRTYDSDVCIIGGGISAAMLALKLTELRPGISITVVEAGRKLMDLENRMRYRQRSIEYAENPWPGDFIEDQSAKGIISRTMALGGSAAAIDVRSRRGLAHRVEGTREILLRGGASPGSLGRTKSATR